MSLPPADDNAERTPELGAAQRRDLRARARTLRPSVQIGAQGLTDGIVAQIRQALHKHELIKIKVRVDRADDAGDIGQQLARRVPCHLLQQIGKVLVVYAPASEASPPS